MVLMLQRRGGFANKRAIKPVATWQHISRALIWKLPHHIGAGRHPNYGSGMGCKDFKSNLMVRVMY
jgi:hypothetical protein